MLYAMAVFASGVQGQIDNEKGGAGALQGKIPGASRHLRKRMAPGMMGGMGGPGMMGGMGGPGMMGGMGGPGMMGGMGPGMMGGMGPGMMGGMGRFY